MDGELEGAKEERGNERWRRIKMPSSVQPS